MASNFNGFGFFSQADITHLENIDRELSIQLHKHSNCDFWYASFQGKGWDSYGEPMHGSYSNNSALLELDNTQSDTAKHIEILRELFTYIKDSVSNDADFENYHLYQLENYQNELNELISYANLAKHLKQKFIYASTDDESLDVAGIFHNGELIRFAWRDELISIELIANELTISPVLTEEYMLEFNEATNSPVWDETSLPFKLAQQISEKFNAALGKAIDLETKEYFGSIFLKEISPSVFESTGGFSSEVLAEYNNSGHLLLDHLGVSRTQASNDAFKNVELQAKSMDLIRKEQRRLLPLAIMSLLLYALFFTMGFILISDKVFNWKPGFLITYSASFLAFSGILVLLYKRQVNKISQSSIKLVNDAIVMKTGSSSLKDVLKISLNDIALMVFGGNPHWTDTDINRMLTSGVKTHQSKKYAAAMKNGQLVVVMQNGEVKKCKNFMQTYTSVDLSNLIRQLHLRGVLVNIY